MVRVLRIVAGGSALAAASNPCSFDGPYANKYVHGCSLNCKAFSTLDDAQTACTAESTCNAITENKDGKFELRSGHDVEGPSPTGETSWLKSCLGNPKIWPVPKTFTAGNETVTVVPGKNFFKVTSTATPTLLQALERYTAVTFPHHTGSEMDGALSDLTITVDDMDESHPQAGHDESYTLEVTVGGSATIAAKTIWGAMHGLETFSQMVVFDFDTETYTIPQAPWKIEDAPRFPWRGLMIDTSRHFQPLESIRSIIDSLPYAKVNVLHWHMSDSQSFPMESKSHPKLWDGAFSSQERYLQSDIADIVEYARLRGVRVMVEFDMPGHAGSWCKGYPEVCPSTSCTQPLNVANNGTFDLITDLLTEMSGGKPSQKDQPSGLFPDNYIHLGGDEVNTNCWTKSAEISAWLEKQGMSADEGYAYFVKRAADIALSVGRRPVQWVEVFDHFGTKLDKQTVIHVWKAKSTLQAVVEAGYSAILNNSPGKDSWYLDHLSVPWNEVYGNEPCSEITDEQCKLVLGGQGEMWGETVDMSDLESTVWPKMAAIAERLWSPRTVVDQGDAQTRLEEFRCLLNARGVRAAPVTGGKARSAPPGPGSCKQYGGGSAEVQV